jgi:hypothetical protein
MDNIYDCGDGMNKRIQKAIDNKKEHYWESSRPIDYGLSDEKCSCGKHFSTLKELLSHIKRGQHDK